MSGVMPRVLAVEDEAAIGELLSISLTAAGFAVEVATTAEDALKSINAVLPEVVLIDWMLPGMSGLQLARRLRDDQRTAGLPLIMLTARGGESDRVAGLESGVQRPETCIHSVDRFITPFESISQVLIAACNGLCSLRT